MKKMQTEFIFVQPLLIAPVYLEFLCFFVFLTFSVLNHIKLIYVKHVHSFTIYLFLYKTDIFFQPMNIFKIYGLALRTEKT